MSVSCTPWRADGCPVHTSFRSRFLQLFGHTLPDHLMLAPRASIMSISCAPCSPWLLLLMRYAWRPLHPKHSPCKGRAAYYAIAYWSSISLVQ